MFDFLGDCVDKGTLHLSELTRIVLKSLHSSYVNPALNQVVKDTSECLREIEVEHDPAGIIIGKARVALLSIVDNHDIPVFKPLILLHFERNLEYSSVIHDHYELSLKNLAVLNGLRLNGKARVAQLFQNIGTLELGLLKLKDHRDVVHIRSMHQAVAAILQVMDIAEIVPTMRELVQIDLIELFHQIQVRRVIPQDSQEFGSHEIIQRAYRRGQEHLDGVSTREPYDESHEHL